MQDIAEQLGLSLATVSLALRDSPQIGEETRERVRELATRLGYVQRGRSVARTELRHITFISPFAISNFFYGAVLRAAEAECRRSGVALHFVQLEDALNPDDLTRYGDGHGILLVGTFDEQLVRQVRRSGQPAILVDNNIPHAGLDRVLIENVGGMYQMALRLIELGHREIMVLRGPEHVPSFHDRMRGYAMAMEQAGLAPRVFPSEPSQRMGATERAFLEWLDAGKPLGCSAIMAMNDEQAIAVMNLLQDHGIHVPEDISVTGFDDIESAQLVRPPLTTCHVPRELLGRTAVRCLLERAREPRRPTIAVVHDTVLVERGSTQPV